MGAEVKVQSFEHKDVDGKVYELKNIIGRLFPEKQKRIILGAHYDTKRYADKDKKHPEAPVMGANDGASGVALLLELARVLKENYASPNVGVDIVFFDGEEGEPDLVKANWEPLGSKYFVTRLRDIYPDQKPILGIVADMVCDKNLGIYKEPLSMQFAGDFVNGFWKVARQTAPEVFMDKTGPAVGDDQMPLIAAGIPSILVIDIEYPYHHTSHDTLDKCSAESLKMVGDAFLRFVGCLR